MGFTGISMKARSILDTISGKIARKGDEIMVEYDRPRGFGEGGNVFNKKKTHFNPWSINLYNEEIPIILNSGGLIGINMDQRILGTKPVTGEYFSKEDFNRILGLRSEDDLSELEDPQKEFIEEPGPETDVKPLRINRKFHLRHVSNAILHVVKQMIIDAEQQGEDPEAAAEKAWKQVVIGSDFDGLIDPVNNCIDCTEFGMMEQELPEMMQEMIEDAQEKAKEDGLELNFFQGDLKERIRDIMFNNGFAFMKKHF